LRIGYITLMAVQVAILAESTDAVPMLQHARDLLARFGVPVVERVLDNRAAVESSVAALEAGGAAVFIVGNVSADSLSTRVAAATAKPVLVVPIESPELGALESLQAATQPGVPAAALAIGKPGAINAALLAIAILANADPGLRAKLIRFREEQTAAVLADRLE
jgi:5-(carboxyamino)imidazole ribonucleotide mutase